MQPIDLLYTEGTRGIIKGIRRNDSLEDLDLGLHTVKL